MKIGCTFRNILGVLALAAAFGCEAAPATVPAPGVGNQDVTGAIGDAGADAGVSPDTTGQGDGGTSDTATGTDDALSGGDALPDGTVLQDTLTGDTTKPDVKGDGGGNVDTKVDVPDTGPVSKKCKADTDCAATGFGACLKGTCNVTSGECELKPAPETTACTVQGVCGGTGTCKQGLCSVASGCATGTCKAQAVKCGETVVVDLPALGASAFSKYACSPTAYDGGEKVLSLGADVTAATIVTVELVDDAAPANAIVALPSSVTGTCNPGACDFTGTKVTFGLQAGQTRVIAVESVKADAGKVTVKVSCQAVVACGDKVCSGDESCTSCPKDCGECKGCGDGKCDAAQSENCASCEKDCGKCATAPECEPSDKPTCNGCACEACVCKMDDYCCKTAWDEQCIQECQDDCKGPQCTPPGFCGDDECGDEEDSKTCPNDCPVVGSCGDGICDKGSGVGPAKEDCTKCSIDCGPCAGSCGDGVCAANEHCGVCPKDCGTCATTCEKPTPGCSGCACEKCVCDADSFCCKTAWDAQCVSACSEKCKGSSCPKQICGDGVCSGTEACKSCPGDCGACPVKCGDGICSSPAETASNCAADCSTGSCAGKCGSSDGQGGAKKCYCDAACEGLGDCCPDKKTVCPK